MKSNKPVCKCQKDQQRLVVNEKFSYKVTYIEQENELHINLNDFVTDGFINLRCFRCNTFFDIDDFKIDWS